MEVPEIDVEEFAARHEAGAFVLDVREDDEYLDGHVPGALHIPLGEVPERHAELPSGEPILVICKSGGRSMRASEVLIANGIDATNVAGGTMAWIDSGRPVVEGEDPG